MQNIPITIWDLAAYSQIVTATSYGALQSPEKQAGKEIFTSYMRHIGRYASGTVDVDLLVTACIHRLSAAIIELNMLSIVPLLPTVAVNKCRTAAGEIVYSFWFQGGDDTTPHFYGIIPQVVAGGLSNDDTNQVIDAYEQRMTRVLNIDSINELDCVLPELPYASDRNAWWTTNQTLYEGWVLPTLLSGDEHQTIMKLLAANSLQTAADGVAGIMTDNSALPS